MNPDDMTGSPFDPELESAAITIRFHVEPGSAVAWVDLPFETQYRYVEAARAVRNYFDALGEK